MGKTIRVAEDRASDQTKTVLPAEVARGVYMQNAPSLQALKVMHLMIATAGGRMADDVRHELRLSQINQIEGMRNHTRASLTPLFAELSAATLIHDDTARKRVVIGGLLDEAQIDYRAEAATGDLLVSWWFRRTFRDMAAASNHWAILDRQTVFHLGSKYAVLLFQHITSLTGLDHVQSKTFTVTELRALLGVPAGKLTRFSNLMQKAIKPAIDDINQLSRFTLTVKANKIGRTVASVEIAWCEKPAEATAEAKRELARPKVGREARRNGTTEAVASAFPAGSIAYSTWAGIARQEMPQPQRDVDLVAADFRRWCERKGISLDAPGQEQRFRTFCRNSRPAE